MGPSVLRVIDESSARPDRAYASLFAGTPSSRSAKAIEVDVGVPVPVAFAGVRRIIQALRQAAPATVDQLARRHPSEWNRLFPGSLGDAPSISDLALSPSERRLHRESEQTFWVLNFAAKVIVDVLQETGHALVLRQSGACDMVSLRGVMRALEWSRIHPVPSEFVFGEWAVRRPQTSTLFAVRHAHYVRSLEARLRSAVTGSALTSATALTADPIVDLEGRYLNGVLDESGSAEARIAASILAIRACFFSTNYDGAMLAAELGLSLLDRAGGKLDPAAIATAWDGIDDPTFVTPAIEVDRASLGDADEVRALLHRQIGVIRSFTGENELALEEFQRGLQCKLTAGRRGQLHMFRALTLIKRVGQVEQARGEIEAALEGIRREPGPDSALQEGWLRNVCALTYFQEKKLEAALQQEKLAMRCVGDLHDASATHLKINLISNISVLQETAKQFTDAITTWRRYEKISENWGANFSKHHCYRLGGLQLRAGESADAVINYVKAYDSAKELGDAFHRQAIAAELGRLHLDAGRKSESMEWFSRAREAADLIGDPRSIAETIVGAGLAAGSPNAAEAVGYAEQSSTFPKEAGALVTALKDSAADPKSLLPAPRTKLNRPFDLVNLY